ncbi:MAG: hypothetical protein HYT10_01875 [Candidatus Levybacteria bacterium]|nr:hypothetical protein [Candidatus Levybacteria bacterium]
MTAEGLIGIPYDRNGGPLHPEMVLNSEIARERANCQRAVQLFYAEVGGFVLPPDDALSAESFDDTRAMVFRDTAEALLPSEQMQQLAFGDLVHAERKSQAAANENPWSIQRKQKLHLAVYVGLPGEFQEHFPGHNVYANRAYFFHGTNGGSRLISEEEFLRRYRMIQARRVLSLKDQYQTLYQSA